MGKRGSDRDIEKLIEESSLGKPEVKAAREAAPQEAREEIQRKLDERK